MPPPTPAQTRAAVVNMTAQIGRTPTRRQHRELSEAIDRLVQLTSAWPAPLPAHILAEARRQVGGINLLLAELALQSGGPSDG